MVTLSSDGVPQGGPVSPVLSNIYLHYVLDLWFERRLKRTCRGYAELTRFADDFVATFRNQVDAMRFRKEVEERLAAFGLRVAPEKTALLRFDGDLLLGNGRPAMRPATFTFLGFTHFLTKARSGVLNIALKPSVKARERFISKVRTWLKVNKHQPVVAQQAHLAKMLNGFYEYFGLRVCCMALNAIRHRVRRAWGWTLRRRSQKAKRRHDWASLLAKPWFQLPAAQVTKAWV